MVWIYIIAVVIVLILLKELIRLPTVGKYGERYVFITGCDTGFGNILAKRLDSLGLNVFAGCYSEIGEDQLRKVSSARLKTLPLDVTSAESIAKAHETVQKHLPADKGLWALVNNADVSGVLGQSEWLMKYDYDACLNVNLFGVINVTKTFQPLVRKGQGRIVNMTSIAGRLAFGGFPYVVSKYGVEGFSDLLRREMSNQGMTVHIVEPGMFNTHTVDIEPFTDSFQRSFHQASPEIQLYYGKAFVEEKKKIMSSTIKKSKSNKADLVVDAYAHAITAMFPRYRYVVGTDAKYLYGLLMYLPEWMSDRFLSYGSVVPAGAKRS